MTSQRTSGSASIGVGQVEVTVEAESYPGSRLPEWLDIGAVYRAAESEIRKQREANREQPGA